MTSAITGLYCLIGSPVAHSLSPVMQNEALAYHKINCTYMAVEITPDQLDTAVKAMRIFNVRGVNVTMPLKEAVLPFMDELSPISQLIGAVNTISVRQGILTGTSTDGRGYIDSLKAKGFSIEDKTLTVLGAGGAAKAIIAQAALDGAKEILIMKRHNASYSTTEDFAKKVCDMTRCRVSVLPFEDMDAMQEAISRSDLLTNATNVGMKEGDSSPVPKEFLRKDLFVSDIIYHPAMTPLLEDAKSIGATFMNGEDMLLYQGAASFQIWTGKEMPLKRCKNAMNEELQRRLS